MFLARGKVAPALPRKKNRFREAIAGNQNDASIEAPYSRSHRADSRCTIT
jgi:hypothetical protein